MGETETKGGVKKKEREEEEEVFSLPFVLVKFSETLPLTTKKYNIGHEF